MNRFLLYLGASVTCVLAALFFVPQFIEWNHYRGVFEDEASRLLGREVRVGGEVNLRLLPTPYIRFDKVRIAGAGNGAREPLFKADEFTVRLAVGPLFRGALEVTHVELTRPVVTLVADERGGGSWSNLGGARPQSAFIASRVALHDVRITNGVVVLKDPVGTELGRFEADTAEFSAAALDGPYKLQAAPKSSTGPRELRLSTAKAEPDGSIHFKATLRVLDTGASYTLDGALADLAGHTHATGDLSAVLPLSNSGSGQKQAGFVPDDAGVGTGLAQSATELKAMFTADMEGAELSDLSLSFESGGRPQLATGKAHVPWHGGQARVDLRSQWLDLDRIASAQTGEAPLGLAAKLATALDGLMPASGSTQAKLNLEQATLGGEIVSGVQLALDKQDGGLKLRELRASLPGGSRLEASGTVTPGRADAAFNGSVVLRGASFNRFLGWAAKGEVIPDGLRQDASFAMRGDLTIGGERISARDVMLQIAGNVLSGGGSWDGGKRRLALSVDGPELDLTPFLHTDFHMLPLAGALLARGGGTDKPATDRDAKAAGPERIAMALHVRAGKLVAGNLSLRDVVADIASDRNSLKISRLTFGSEDGLAAELSGEVTGLNGRLPKGNVGGLVTAKHAAAVHRLLDVLGAPDSVRPSLRRAEALAPLRLAGTLAIGARAAPTFDLSVDGTFGGSRLSARLGFDDADRSLAQQHIEASASIEGAEVSPLLAQLLPDALAAAAEAGVRTPSKATLKSSGVPARGLVSLVALDAPGLAGEFRGRVTISESGAVAADGETRVAADDFGHAMALVGLSRRQGLEGVPLRVTLGTTLRDKRLGLDTRRLALGPTTIAGELAVQFGGDKPRFEGTLHASEVSLPRLLSLTKSAQSEPATAAVAANDNATSPWPEAALDATILADIDGKLQLDTPLLTIGSGVALHDAGFDAEISGGQLAIGLRETRALGGQVSAKLNVERGAAGIGLRGTIKLAHAQLEGFSSAKSPVAIGRFSASLDFSSVGLSARGFVGAAHGKGTIALEQARLTRMSPAAINAAALATLATPSDDLGVDLKRHLGEQLAASPVALGSRQIAVELADGIMRMEPLTIDTPDGRVAASTTVELENMMIDSEWRIDPKQSSGGTGPRGAALPGISLVYVGPLAKLGAIDPKLNSDLLERELSVRKLERYADELERLRREDQERARQEAERMRLLELERQHIEQERQRQQRSNAIEKSVRPASATAPISETQSPNPRAQRDERPPKSSERGPATAADLIRDTADRSQ